MTKKSLEKLHTECVKYLKQLAKFKKMDKKAKK